MKNLICAVLLAAAFVASGSAAMAASKKVHKAQKVDRVHRMQKLPDWSKPTHGYPFNSKEGQRAFWQDQERRQR